MVAKSITFTTIEGEIADKLDEMFGVNTSFVKVQPNNCLVPPQFVAHAKKIRDMEVYEDDIWMVSYPRTGSHWVQEMVWCIGNDCNYEKAKSLFLMRSPHLEATPFMVTGRYVEFFAKMGDSVENISNMPRPRFIKSHLPLELLPVQLQQKKPKIIYVARNAKDMCVSFYHYCQSFHDMTGSFDDFAELILKEHGPLGCYWKHVLTFWKIRDQENILFLTYEDMKKKQVEVIKRTAKFLGKTVTDDQISELGEHLKFSKMAENSSVNMEFILPEKCTQKDPNSKFIRKGKVGDWRNYMSDQLSKRFDEWTEKYLQGSDLKIDTEVDIS